MAWTRCAPPNSGHAQKVLPSGKPDTTAPPFPFSLGFVGNPPPLRWGQPPIGLVCPPPAYDPPDPGWPPSMANFVASGYTNECNSPPEGPTTIVEFFEDEDGDIWAIETIFWGEPPAMKWSRSTYKIGP